MKTRVKICGLKEPAHAAAASRLGADYVGVVFAERVRRVTPEEAASVVGALEGETAAVGVFVDADPTEILWHRDAAGFAIAQLHGAESVDDSAALRAEGLGVWKALRPTSRDTLSQGWEAYAGVVDAILVEGFSAEAAGGTGSSFPYEWLEDLDRDGLDLVLAGGLNPHNVGDAIWAGRPDVVDVSSGVEEMPGVKSVDLIRRFLDAVHDARVPIEALDPPAGEAG